MENSLKKCGLILLFSLISYFGQSTKGYYCIGGQAYTAWCTSNSDLCVGPCYGGEYIGQGCGFASALRIVFHIPTPKDQSNSDVISNALQAPQSYYNFLESIPTIHTRNFNDIPDNIIADSIKGKLIYNLNHPDILYVIDPYKLSFPALLNQVEGQYYDFLGVKLFGNPSKKGKVKTKLISTKYQTVTVKITFPLLNYTKSEIINLIPGVNHIKFKFDNNITGFANFSINSIYNTYSKSIIVCDDEDND